MPLSRWENSYGDACYGHLIGEQIGPYKIIRTLGQGGFGEVYLAQQLTPQRQVAIKISRFGKDRALQGRFQLESQALAVLNHPNIAQVYNVGIDDMERPLASDLERFLKNESVSARPTSWIGRAFRGLRRPDSR